MCAKSGSFQGWLSHRPIREFEKALKIRLPADDYRPRRGACCPIEPEDFEDVAPHPKAAPDCADQAREAQRPPGDMLEVPQDEVGEQRRPDLPLDRVLVLAVEGKRPVNPIY